MSYKGTWRQQKDIASEGTYSVRAGLSYNGARGAMLRQQDPIPIDNVFKKYIASIYIRNNYPYAYLIMECLDDNDNRLAFKYIITIPYTYSNNFKNYQIEITGAGGHQDQFAPGTKKVKFYLYANASDSDHPRDQSAYFDNFKFEIKP